MCRMFALMMLPLKCLPHEYSGEHGKNERLQKCDQHLNEINEYRKCDRDQRTAPACRRMNLTENKDQGDEANDDDMSCHHVGEQTYDQGNRLDENTEKFNRY